MPPTTALTPAGQLYQHLSAELGALETLRYRLAAATLLAGAPRWATTAATDVADAVDVVQAATLARIAVQDQLAADLPDTEQTLADIIATLRADPLAGPLADTATAVTGAVQACRDLAGDTATVIADALSGVTGRLEMLLGDDGTYKAYGTQARPSGRSQTGLRLDTAG